MPTTIIVADDHQIVRQGIRKLLETRSDFEVVGEASDREEAV
jgi:DNA-binding NarL/FixJ family response regulator